RRGWSMNRQRSLDSSSLNLRAGDLVEVRSREEILATLDEQGRLDALPFMPEMLQFAGQRFRVFKRADKTCDTIERSGARRMYDTVHLDGLRCDGQAHGGCQMRCLLFWKEAWLKRLEPRGVETPPLQRESAGCSEAALYRAARVAGGPRGSAEERFACQATELLRATRVLRWWDVRQYIRDVRSRNVRLRDVLRGIALAVFNTIQRHRGGRRYPDIRGALTKTPAAAFGLCPGDEVRVKPKEGILETLDMHRRNRGLYFDPEMVRYCGRTFKVLARPKCIIDEQTGRMMTLPTECVILDGATCVGDLSINPNRLFCPRSIYPFWREIWLERVGDAGATSRPGETEAAGESGPTL
ncbi:MAG: hypothetical protein ACRD2X_25275, partial [Vicinamibacteraceae bacterium]